MNNEFVCLQGLNPRVISPNPHQTEEFKVTCNDDRCTLVRRVDQLSTHLYKANQEATWLLNVTNMNLMQSKDSPMNQKFQRDLVIQMLMDKDESADEKKPLVANKDTQWEASDVGVPIDEPVIEHVRSETSHKDDTFSQLSDEKQNGDKPSSSSNDQKPDISEHKNNSSQLLLKTEDTTTEKAVQVKISYKTDGSRQSHDFSCVDLKSMAKLRKLCYLLRRNVVELKIIYDKRCHMGYTFTESEHTGLEVGLETLEADVLRLLRTLDDINGYRDEIKMVLESYKLYELRYRELRLLNKKAKMRHQDIKPENENVSNDASVINIILRKYFCRPCYRVYRRFIKPVDKNG